MCNNIQSSTNSKISYSPSPFLLNNWKLWIIKAVLDKWQNEKQENCAYEDALSSIKLHNRQSNLDLLLQLKSKIEKEIILIDCIDQLEDVNNHLRQHFDNVIIKNFQEANQRFRDDNIKKVHNLLSHAFMEASPKESIDFLDEYSKKLSKQMDDFEALMSKNLKQEHLAWEKYLSLSHQLRSTNNADLKNISNILYIWFKARLEVEKYAAFAQFNFSLIQLCSSYLDSANRSFIVFQSIQESVEQKITLELISIPILIFIKDVDISGQKELIEDWIGYSLQYLGNAPVSWQQLEAKLLTNTEALALEIFDNFFNCFMES